MGRANVRSRIQIKVRNAQLKEMKNENENEKKRKTKFSDAYLKHHHQHYFKRLLRDRAGERTAGKHTQTKPEREREKTKKKNSAKEEKRIAGGTQKESCFHFTSASLSKRAKSSFSIFTRSWALYVEEMAVNPTISAYSMLFVGAKKNIYLYIQK